MVMIILFIYVFCLINIDHNACVCTFEVNTKYLAPLFVAYDDRLAEKDGVIKHYEVSISVTYITTV